MKKLIYCALALATGLFAASCQQESLEPVQGGNTVTFTVEIPEVATKAAAVGNEANKIDDLVYAVYRTSEDSVDEALKDWNANTTFLYAKNYDVNPFNNGSATISLELLNDQNHIVLLWAQHDNTWVTGYDATALTNISYPEHLRVNTEGTENTEPDDPDMYAAFSTVKFIAANNRANASPIVLTRPFAQINLATVKPENYYVEISGTEVTVNGAGTAFNVASQSPAGNANVTYTWAGKVSADPLTVNSQNYDHYLAMGYVFASDAVSVDYTITTTSGHGTITNSIPNVPVAKNYRTNIIGNLLTSDVKYNVTLDKEWGDDGKNMDVVIEGLVNNINGDYEITTVEGFAYAINNLFADGGTFYIHPGTYNFTGIKVEPKETNQGAILNVKANVVPVVTRSTTPEFEIIGLNVPLVAKVSVNSQALFSNIVLPEDTKLVGTNNGVVGISGCSNGNSETGEDLITDNTNGEVVDTASMDSVDEITAAIDRGLMLVELTGNVREAKTLSLTSSVIIDGNGYTWTYTGSDRAITAENNVSNIDIIIKNFNLELSAGYCQRGINFNVPDGTLTIENVKVSANEEYTPATYAINLPGSSDNSRVTIKDSHIRGNIALNVWGENMRINATNTEFVSYDANPVENYSAIVLNNDGSTFANETVVNINGGKIIALDENGEESYAIRNSTMTGQVIVSETTEVVGTVSNPVAVVVYEGYNEFYSFTTLQQAIDKVCKDNNGSVRLIKDITVSETVVVPADETVVIDLNGKTLTGTMPKSVGHVLKNEGTLTLKNGTISSTGANGGSAICNEGTLTVQNVTVNGASIRENEGWPSYPVNNYSDATFENVTITGYQGAVACNAAGTTTLTDCTINKEYLNTSSHVFYINHADAKVIVNSGTYTHKGMDGSLAYVNKGQITVNGGTFSASNGGYGMAVLTNGKIVVNGGDFKSAFLNWGGSITVTGGTFTHDPKNYLAEGYKAVTKNNIYTVIPSDYELVGTADELVKALEDNKSVLFANDIKIDPANMSNAYGKTGINVKNGQTINGNGYTLNIKGAGGTWDSGINTTGGLIKNITVTGSFRGIFINHTSTHSEKVVLENVTIGGNGTVYTISCDQGLYQGIEATDCTFNGWTSFAKDAGEAKFVNCSFGEGSGYKYCRPYSNTEFVNCTFCPGYAVDTTLATVTFTDCTWEE